jgi:uncharacterized membrane protein
MLASFAGTGLTVGLLSLDVVRVAWHRIGGSTISRVVVATALALSSVGVYLGRVFRFNSWDAFTRPLAIGHVLLRAWQNPAALRMTSVLLPALTVSLVATYGVFCGVALAHREISSQRDAR